MFKLSPERSCAVDVEVGISGLTAFTTSVAQPETKIRSATARPKSRTQRVKCMWLVRWRFESKRQRRDNHQSTIPARRRPYRPGAGTKKAARRLPYFGRHHAGD